MALYSEKLAEEAAAQEKQQDVANEVAENELLENEGLEADADDNYDVEEVTDAVDALVTAAVGDSGVGGAGASGVIGASQEALGNNTPINDETIAIARNHLNDEISKAQSGVDALKGPKMTAVNNLQKKLDAYQKAADAVEGNVTNANKAGVAIVAGNLDEDGKNIVTNVAITNLGVKDSSFANNGNLTATLTVAGGSIEITYTDGVLAINDTAAFNKLSGSAQFLTALEKVHNSLNAAAKAQGAVETAIGGVLSTEEYKLVKLGAGDDATEMLAAATTQSWNKLPFEDGVLLAFESNNGGLVAAGDAAAGEFALIDKNGGIVDVGADLNDALYNAVTGFDDGTGAITGTVDSKPANEIADGVKAAPLAALGDTVDAVKALADAKNDLDTFNKAVENWKEVSELQKQLETEADNVEAAAEAVAEAEELFEDLGVQLVKAEDGVADGDVYNENDEDQLADLFVYGDKALTVENFDGEDLFYFGQSPDGSQYNLVVLGKNESITDSVGAENAFDIFAVQNGANTTLYVEQKAFAGNGSSTADLVKVELVGVTADELAFNDGFLTFA